MIDILFFTCEPGGAEVLIPVIKKMKEERDYNVTVLSYGYALDRFDKKEIIYHSINKIEKDEFSLFDIYNPDIIITSATSLPQKDMSEKYLWHNAKQKNILTIAFLDQWQNYAIRFSGTSKDEYMIYQPDLINCINDIGKQEMLKLGFEEKKLVTFGQPYLSDLNQNINKGLLKEKLNIQKERETILFVSEAIEEHFGKSRGYTQYETIEYLMQNKEFLEDKQVIIKLHPKDKIEKFQQYNNVILIQNEYSALEMIDIADYVIGMTSIMLIEAFILKKKVLSIQLNSTKDLLLLSKKGYITVIINKSQYISKQCFINNGCFEYEFDYVKLINLLSNTTHRPKVFKKT